LPQTQITERQQDWRDHVLAAAQYAGSIVEYAAANNLKTKDIYQWKTALTKRGFLPVETNEPESDFTEVNLVSTSALGPVTEMSAEYRLTLPCGSVLEYFNPVDPDALARLLAGLRN